MNVEQPIACAVCGYAGAPSEKERVRGNIRRLREKTFEVWRCAQCRCLHCEKVEDLAGYYKQYPVREQKLDYFLRAWYGEVLKRMIKAGVKPDHQILDYGCNKGLFLDFLKEKGFRNCVGYDPFMEQFRSTDVLKGRYDAVVSMDVIEHDEDPVGFLARHAALLRSGGLLFIETPNAEGIVLDKTEEYVHALHMPYHVHILSQQALQELARKQGLEEVAVYNRWYMDSPLPAASRRLFESLMMYGGNDLDLGYEPPRIDLFFKHPVLFVYLFLGYFLPPQKRDHMMMIFKYQ